MSAYLRGSCPVVGCVDALVPHLCALWGYLGHMQGLALAEKTWTPANTEEGARVAEEHLTRWMGVQC